MRKAARTALVSLLLAAPAAGLEPGDLLVAADASLFRIDPETGEVELFSPDPSFGRLKPSRITGIAATAAGDEVFVVLAAPVFEGASVWRIDPETGSRFPIAQLGGARSPDGIAIDAAGDLLVPHVDGVSRIDPRSGAESVFGSIPPGAFPTGIAVEASGDLLVSTHERVGALSRVVRIEPGAADSSGVGGLRGGVFSDIALEADGSIVVPVSSPFTRLFSESRVPPFPPAVLRIDPQSGAREFVATSGLLRAPSGLAVGSDGDILVLDLTLRDPAVSIVRIDPRDGSQTLVAEVPGLRRASAIGVVPAPEVSIDVRPSRIAVPSRRTLAVLLVGSEHLDVAEVDPASLAFGPGAAAPRRSLRVGRRGDAFPDLLLLFRAADAGLRPGDTRACLSGATGRFAFEACDAVSVVEPPGRARP